MWSGISSTIPQNDTYHWAMLLPGIYPKELKIDVPIKIYTQMFIAALFIAAKDWKQFKCPFYGCRNRQNMVYPDNRLVFHHSKESSSDTCCHMDEPWKHKWKKPDTKGHCTRIFHKCCLDPIWSHGENSHFPFVGSLLGLHPIYFPMGLWHSCGICTHSQLPGVPRQQREVASSSLELFKVPNS